MRPKMFRGVHRGFESEVQCLWAFAGPRTEKESALGRDSLFCAGTRQAAERSSFSKPTKRDSPSFDSCGRPIGSGVTEAAGKTRFTQRFKQSGMKWCWNCGHPIINLRTILRSGLGSAVRERAWTSYDLRRRLPDEDSHRVVGPSGHIHHRPPRHHPLRASSQDLLGSSNDLFKELANLGAN